jgi:hypothetical protein
MMPDPSGIKRWRLAARQNPVQIAPADSAESGMKFSWHLNRMSNADRHSGKMGVQRLHHPTGGEFIRNVKMRCLRGGMNPGIGAPCAGNRNWCQQKSRSGIFNPGLNRIGIILTLPP